MNTHSVSSSTALEDRISHQFDQKAAAVVSRIRSLMGDMTQSELAERTGKGDSTVSDHLSGTVNLTLRTIAEYEVALDDVVVSVPEPERSKRRQRRRASGSRRVSDERKKVRDIPPSERRLHRLLTHVSARIGCLLDADEGCTQQELANRIDKDPAYVSRVLGGGINLTLKTIVQFEEALEACILEVRNRPKGTYTGRHEATVQSVHRPGDGCHFEDQEGKVSKGMTGYLKSEGKDVVADEPVMAA